MPRSEASRRGSPWPSPAACFLVGAGIIHIRDIAETGNLAPGNAGPIMITDFLTPVAVLVLLFFSSEGVRPKSPATLALEAELKVARDALRSYRNALDRISARTERSHR